MPNEVEDSSLCQRSRASRSTIRALREDLGEQTAEQHGAHHSPCGVVGPRYGGEDQEQPGVPQASTTQIAHGVGHVLLGRLGDAPAAQQAHTLAVAGPQQEEDQQADAEHDDGDGDLVVQRHTATSASCINYMIQDGSFFWCWFRPPVNESRHYSS
jgi:hypothetical protein